MNDLINEIPEGIQCFKIMDLKFDHEEVNVEICPFLEIDEENDVKRCIFLNGVEIFNMKECQINLGVE